MRFRAFALAVVFAVFVPAAVAAAAPPNLEQEPQQQSPFGGNPLYVDYPLQIQQVNGREHLVFGSTIDMDPNAGPLTLSGSRADTTVDTMAANQVVDGKSTPVGVFQYNVDPSHHHWHFLNLDRYELRRHDAGARQIARDQKTGFCVAPASGLQGADCARDVPGALSVSETLAAGGFDTYTPAADGQYIDVTRLAPGEYELVQWVNSDCSIKETTYDDNARAMVFAVNADRSITPEPNATPFFNAWWAANPSRHCLPRETVRPRVSGSPAVGGKLSATPSGWLERLATGFQYQWRRCNAHGNACQDIRGATSPSYTVKGSDKGHTLRARVTASAGPDVEELTPQDSAQSKRVRRAISADVPSTMALANLVTHGVGFRVTCASACTVKATLTLKSTVFGQSSVRLKGVGGKSGRVKAWSRMRSRVRRAKPKTVLVRFTVKPRHGHAKGIVKRIRVSG